MAFHLPSSTAGANRWRSRSLLFIAFTFIVVVFVALHYAVSQRAHAIERETHLIVENMLTSVEMVSRIGRDIVQERNLIDAHILASSEIAMSNIDTQIAEVQTDFAKTAAAYQPLPILPGERGSWDRLQARVQALSEPLAKLLVLSRRNEDSQAREMLHSLEPQFDQIAGDVDDLIQINRQGMQRQVASIISIQSSIVTLQTVLTALGIAATLAVGWLAIRLIGQREDQLQRTAALLESQNSDLDAFAGRVAHDLRNPLSTVSLAALKLEKNVPEQNQIAGMIRRGVDTMDALIRDLLALSQANAAMSEVCDPAKVVAGIREDLSPRLECDGGTIQMNVVPAKVRGSEGLLRQAVWNLVDNAVKYRRPDVAVHVDLAGRLQRKTYELRVSDNGIGMSQDESPKAFEAFYRARRSHDVAGTGLGLSIVKRVVEASGGTVTVHSQLGQGTTFIINLPIA